jgi:ABC-type branched-subunit amino acid transport system substrate-binding protein
MASNQRTDEPEIGKDTIVLQKKMEPFRIGVIKPIFMEWNQFAFDEAYARGIIRRPVQLIPRHVDGAPVKDSGEVIDAFYDLAEKERVLGIIGIWDTDNALALLPHIEKAGVPTFSICGSQEYAGRWAFNISNGGMADEPAVMAAWLRGKGYRRVGVIRESTQIGEEYTRYFRMKCQENGLRIAAEAQIEPLEPEDTLTEQLGIVRDSRPDALAYFGIGYNGPKMNPALARLGWDPPKIMCTAFVGATFSRKNALALDGWVGVDQYHEDNAVNNAVVERFQKKTGQYVRSSIATTSYDVGHALAIGLGRMRHASPAGLRDALETVRRVPACTGAPGTVITFGPYDHRGLHGPDFLILRRSSNGTTTLEGEAPVDPWDQP